MADSANAPSDERPQDKMAPPDRAGPADAPADDAAQARRPAPGEERDLWAGRASAKFFYGKWALLIVISILLLVAGFMLRGSLERNWPILLALALIALGLVALLAQVGYFVLATRYRVTTQRLFVEQGILIRTVNQTDLIRVNDVSVTQTLFGRLFNVGTVTVDCPTDVSHPKILIMGIVDPHQVAEHIHREMRAIRDRKALMMEAT